MLGLYAVIGGRGYVNLAYASRTFFGTYRVIADPGASLFHPLSRHDDSRTPERGLGRAADLLPSRQSDRAGVRERPAPMKSVAAVGLGTGTLAAYAEPGQQWTFYEIDPEVERIAPRYPLLHASRHVRIAMPRGDRRRPAVAAAADRHPRHHRPRRVQLGFDPDPSADTGSGADCISPVSTPTASWRSISPTITSTCVPSSPA